MLHSLHQEGALRGSLPISRLMIFGALNWSVQWYDPARAASGGASLDDLADNALLLFLHEPPSA